MWDFRVTLLLNSVGDRVHRHRNHWPGNAILRSRVRLLSDFSTSHHREIYQSWTRETKLLISIDINVNSGKAFYKALEEIWRQRWNLATELSWRQASAKANFLSSWKLATPSYPYQTNVFITVWNASSKAQTIYLDIVSTLTSKLVELWAILTSTGRRKYAKSVNYFKSWILACSTIYKTNYKMVYGPKVPCAMLSAACRKCCLKILLHGLKSLHCLLSLARWLSSVFYRKTANMSWI